MKKILLLLPIFLFALSIQDTKAFMKWSTNPNSNFNVIDYVIENNSINYSFPSLKTQSKNKSFKIIVLKKFPKDYTLGLYSFDTNSTVKFSKTLILRTMKFDIYSVSIPYEYRDLRFCCLYNGKKDYSTDNFSVKPNTISTNNKYIHNFTILVDNGKSKYYDKGKNNLEHYTYTFKNGKGIVNFWLTNTNKITFCLNENWTNVDIDDTLSTERNMPCINLLLPPIKGYWTGIGSNKRIKTIDINLSKRTYIKKVNW